MKDKIREITNTLSNFASVISKNSDLMQFLLESTSFLPSDAKTSERIYVLLNDDRPECAHGKMRKFNGINSGYGKCGRAKSCLCAHDNMSAKISATSKKKDWQEIGEKRRQTNVERYGVEHNSQIEDVKKSKKQTCLMKFGHETNLLSDDTKDKIIETNIERYGTPNPMKNKDVVAKAVNTLKEKYGENFTPFMRREEFEQTMLDKHGASHALQSPEIYQKRTETTVARYGVHHASLLTEFKEKAKQTSWSTYGAPHSKQAHLTPAAISLVNDDDLFRIEYERIGFMGIRLEYGVSSQIIRSRCKRLGLEYDLNLTQPEQIIFNILSDFTSNIIVRDRTIIKPWELDFYLPDHSLAIEICGLAWHSEVFGKKDRQYHKTKMDLCNKAGIRLITIFDDEIEDKLAIVKNRLQYILGHGQKICGARQVSIRAIENKPYNNFVNSYHIQGSVSAQLKLGAFYKDDLVAIMSFGKKRKALGSSDDGGFELLRFCSAGIIPGVGSKLFKHFVLEYNPSHVISYCDLRWGSGNFYENIGFEYAHTTVPNYWYTYQYTQRFHRYKFAKHQLIKEGYSQDSSEWEIMKSRKGYDRIWDCGSNLYQWTNPNQRSSE